MQIKSLLLHGPCVVQEYAVRTRMCVQRVEFHVHDKKLLMKNYASVYLDSGIRNALSLTNKALTVIPV